MRTLMGHQHKNTGFTIVELLIVVVVIAILAAITVVAYNGIQQRAKVAALQSSSSSGAKALEVAKIQGGQYPESLPSSAGSSNTTYEKSSVTDNFCLTKANGDVHYFVTSQNNTPTPGTCVGMVAWWPLNGNTKDVMNSYDGSSPTGTSTVGHSGKADSGWLLVGDSTPRFVSTPLSFSPANFTTSIWAKSDGGGPSAYGAIMSTTRDCCSSYTGMQLAYNRTNFNISVALWTGGGAPAAGINQVNAMTTGQWKHLVVSYDGSTLRLYINGVETSAVSYVASPAPGNSTHNLKLGGGGWSTTGYSFGGVLDDARVYNRAITPDEVSEMYNQGAQ
jgi:prepilin-type N-terminal cleavage/methylation domain-containing protein